MRPLTPSLPVRAALLAAFLGPACHRGSDGPASGGGAPGADAPTTRALARYEDRNRDGACGPGDAVIVAFDFDVVLDGDDPRALNPSVGGDSFGAGALLRPGPGPREVTLELGTGAHLRTRGMFAAGRTEPGRPSGVDVTPGATSIRSALDGTPARPSSPVDLAPAFVAGDALDAPGARDVVAADLDRDGDQDLVFGGLDGGVTVLLGDGTGGFDGARTGLGGATVLAIALGDVDRDGYLDLAVGTDGPDRVLRNASATEPGLFQPFPGTLGQDPTLGLAFTDLDHDGALDLVAARVGPNRVYLGDGLGGFAEGPPLGASTTACVVAGDFDRDGDADVVFGQSGPNELWLGDGSGALALAPARLGTAITFDLAAGDVDGDGILDLLEANRKRDVLWRGDGQGGFHPSPVFLGAAETRSVVLLDVDGDGRLDLVQGRRGEVRVRLNAGGLRFVDLGQALAIAPQQTFGSLAIADFDGDGDTDVAAALDSSPQLVWFNSLAGTFGDLALAQEPADYGDRDAFALAVGDVDADGDLDFLTGATQALTVWRNDDAAGLFSVAAEYALPQARVRDLALTDIDRDGDLDLVAALVGSGPAVWLGDGLGAFEPVDAIPGPPAWFLSVAIGDLDRDGAPDLVLGSVKEHRDVVHRNLGGGGTQWLGFGPALPFGEPAETNALALGDLDGDGRLDVVTGRGAPMPDRVWIGTGDGHFVSTGQEFGSKETRDAELADLDRDGDLDLVLASAGGEAVWLGRGDGTFDPGAQLSDDDAHAAVAVDVDGDGRLDLVVGDAGSYGVKIWRGDGRSGFGPAPIARAPQTGVRALRLADFDGDGDSDILCGNADGVPNRIWRNGP